MRKKKANHQQKESDLYSYIEDIKRWQQNQYLPGAYLGGNIHPMFRSKTKFGGIFLFISGLFLLGWSLFAGFQLLYASAVERSTGMSNFFFVFIVGVLSAIVGWKFLIQSARREKRR